MPCYSPPMYKDEFGEWKDGELPQELFDKLVRLLCEANQLIDDRDELGYETHTPRSKELAQWWKEHQEWDRARKRKQK